MGAIYNINGYPPYSALGAVYQGSKRGQLEECLDSLCRQTLLPYETIVAVDGPVPGEIIDCLLSFKSHLSIHLVFLGKNMGLALALNKALQYVNTPYIMRFDTDDINMSNRALICLSALLATPLDVVGSYVFEFKTSFGFSEKETTPPQGFEVKHVPLCPQKISESIVFRNPLNHPSVMYRTEVVKSVGGYPPVPFLEDYCLWALLLGRKALIQNIPQPLVAMRADNILARRQKVSISSLLKLSFILFKSRLANPVIILVVLILKIVFYRLPHPLFTFIYRIGAKRNAQ